MSAEDIKALVDARLAELAPLHSRMDVDRDIIFNTEYAMPSLLHKGKNELDISNVSLPIGKLYSENVVSSLVSAAIHREVIGMTDKATTKLENFLADVAYERDAALSEMGEPTADETMFDFLCNRGACAEIWLPVVDNGCITLDVRPTDTRYLAVDFGHGGLPLFAPTFVRAKSDIEAEYDITVKSETAPVIDAWTPKEHCTWVEDIMVRNEANTWGFVPGVFTGVALGSSMREENAAGRKWESIFNTSRSLYAEANFIASILKTQNYSAVKPALQSPPDKDGEYQKNPPEFPAPASITPTKGLLARVDIGDLKAYTVRYYEIINQLISMATFSSLEPTVMGDASAVAIARIQANRSKMQTPRFKAAAQFRAGTDRLFIRQVKRLFEMGKIGSTFEMGRPGHEKTYSVTDLDGDYTIKYSFYSMTTEDLAGNAAVANALGTLVSEDYKRREILRIENPDGEKAKQRAELAERLDPVISLIEQGHALIDEGTDIADLKARRILQKILGIIKQERLAEQQPLVGNIERGSTSPANPTQALPLFGGAMSKGAK